MRIRVSILAVMILLMVASAYANGTSEINGISEIWEGVILPTEGYTIVTLEGETHSLNDVWYFFSSFIDNNQTPAYTLRLASCIDQTRFSLSAGEFDRLFENSIVFEGDFKYGECIVTYPADIPNDYRVAINTQNNPENGGITPTIRPKHDFSFDPSFFPQVIPTLRPLSPALLLEAGFPEEAVTQYVFWIENEELIDIESMEPEQLLKILTEELRLYTTQMQNPLDSLQLGTIGQDYTDIILPGSLEQFYLDTLSVFADEGLYLLQPEGFESLDFDLFQIGGELE
jgi:hypothetical protein